MEQLSFQVKVRSLCGSANSRRIRLQKSLVGIIYGNIDKPINVEFSSHDFTMLQSRAPGRDYLYLKLTIADSEGKTQDLNVIIKEIQRDRVNGKIKHVDFMAVDTSKNIATVVPVVLIGVPIGVKVYGGILQQLKRKLKISGKVETLLDVIPVPVEELSTGQSLHISDIKLPADVICGESPGLVVAQVSIPRSERTEDGDDNEDSEDGEEAAAE